MNMNMNIKYNIHIEYDIIYISCRIKWNKRDLTFGYTS